MSSMCTGNCPISEYCLRYMGKSDSYGQTYSHLENICIPNNYAELIPYEENKQKENIITEEISFTIDDFIMDELHRKQSETN